MIIQLNLDLGENENGFFLLNRRICIYIFYLIKVFDLGENLDLAEEKWIFLNRGSTVYRNVNCKY